MRKIRGRWIRNESFALTTKYGGRYGGDRRANNASSPSLFLERGSKFKIIRKYTKY
jgi:hypothetical protein